MVINAPDGTIPPPARVSFPSYVPCPRPVTEPRKRVREGGKIVAVIQCLRCGHEVKSLKAGASPYDKKEFDEQLRVTFREAERRKEEEELDRNRRELREWYNRVYLRSSVWQRIRLLVLERDKDLCQGCLKATATVVHHRNYDHVGTELLYDLLSLCKSCHDKVHPEKQGGAS